MNAQIQKNIDLSFQLTNYLLKNPTKGEGYDSDQIVIFSVNDKDFNKINLRLLKFTLRKYKQVIVAIHDSSNNKNVWKFDLATMSRIPDSIINL